MNPCTESGSESEEESSEESEKTSSDSSGSEESSSESEAEPKKKKKTKKVPQKKNKPTVADRYSEIPPVCQTLKASFVFPVNLLCPDVTCFFSFFSRLAN